MDELLQVVKLLLLAIPIAWLAWTVTHEEIFREMHDYCVDRSRACNRLLKRKFFYLFTCEYCFSHWCTLLFQLFFQFKLVYDDWRGYLVSIPALVWTANVYMNLYQRTRVDIRKERAIANLSEKETQAVGTNGAARDGARPVETTS
jgi:hypothetical protein